MGVNPFNFKSSLMSKSNSMPSAKDPQQMINQIVIEHLQAKKQQRFWRSIYRIFYVLALLLTIYFLFFQSSDDAAAKTKPHVGLIDLVGEIGENQSASTDNFVKGLDSAYENKMLSALIIRINSPGGSPVQADDMYRAVRYYQGKYPAIKIHAVCVDLCASAAYYVAAAADDIYVNPSSMVGSIGVIYNGFGFVDSLQKLGITRRLQTAGRNKGFLDPFSPEDPSQKQNLQAMLDLVHQQFIERVKEGRGSRLHIDEDTFSGLIWTGTQAKERGLADEFGSSVEVARDVIKVDKIVDYTYKPGVMDQLLGRLGAQIVHQLPGALGLHSIT